MEYLATAAPEPLPHAYACCDADLRLTSVNEAFAQLLGQPVAALQGQLAPAVAQHFAAGAGWLAALRHVRESSAAVAFMLPTPGTGFNASSQILEVWPALAEGRVMALLTMVRTMLPPQAEAEIAQQRDQLARANGHLENFVYTAAHDLQSPVGNLSVLLQFLREHPAEADRNLLLEHMHESLRQLQGTITDLVEVLEVQSTFRVVAHRISLTQAYANALAELATELTSTDATIETDFSGLPELVYVRSYLQSILRNLLSNAVKYRAPNRSLRICVRSWREDGLAMLSVQDNGLGMDLVADGHKLFRPFSRLTTQGPGKGIGLHLVQNIVQRNGGHILVDSQLDQGTTFTCLLHEYEL
jgi:signal transduction histidine kinase